MFSPGKIDLTPARRARWVVVLSHAGGGWALLLSELPAVIWGLALALLLFSARRAWRKSVSLDHPRALRSLQWQAAGWQATTGDGRCRGVEPLPALVSRELTVLRLRFKDSGQIHDYLLHADSAPPEALRRLRVMLRWGRPSAAIRTSAG